MQRSNLGKVAYFGISTLSLRSLVAASSVLILTHQEMTAADIGQMKSLQLLLLLIIEAPIAYFSDRVNKRYIVALSLIFSSVWLFLTALCSSFTTLCLAECFNALALACFNCPYDAYLTDWFLNKNKPHGTNLLQKYLGTFGEVNFYCMGIFTFLGGLWLTVFPLNFIWFIVGALTFLFLFYFYLGLRSEDYLAHYEKIHQSESSINIKAFDAAFWKALVAPERKKELIGWIFFSILINILLVGLIQFWQLILLNSVSKCVFSNFISVMSIMIMFSQAFGSRLFSQHRKIPKFLRLYPISASLTFMAFIIFLNIGVTLNIESEYTKLFLLFLQLILLLILFRGLTITASTVTTPNY